MRILTALVLAIVPAAAPLAADCRASAGNLLATSNCGFDAAVTGWTSVPEVSLSRDPADGGALQAVADTQGSLSLEGPCTKVTGGTAYRIGARLRLVSGNAYFCAVNAFQYSDESCEDGQEPLGSAAAPPEPGWAEIAGGGTTAPAAKSVRLRPGCSGEPGFTVRFDDFVFAPGGVK